MILRGFYGIVDSGDVDHATTLVRAGACAIQLRMKRATASEILAAARALRGAITTVPFVVND
ncbi:MAG TPA: hypothetical protein VLB44_00745, partial [Kofleriaceae bacterium]|nr:hypothetical protein [Kofleriaceae bacterium]